MKARFSEVHWILVLEASIAVYVLTFLLGAGLSLLLPALLNPGQQDTGSGSAVQAVSVVTVLLLVVVTGGGAMVVARRVEHEAILQGFLVGLCVAILSFALDVAFSKRIEPVGLAFYALMIAAGSLGGILGSRNRQG